MASSNRSVAQLARVFARPWDRPSSDFDLNSGDGGGWSVADTLTDAAVLVPLIQTGDGLQVILTKRASHLMHHPGQIALPGGKRDAGDRSLAETALRETGEEIGLQRGNVEMIGEMPYHETVTGFRVTPFVARVLQEFDPIPEVSEVDEVFRVPFSYLADPANYLIEGRRWAGLMRRYYVIPYGPYYIWGATARILRALAERIDACSA
ncbi:MAG: NUDIX hydrolase [Paracoccaceae bacterium]